MEKKKIIYWFQAWYRGKRYELCIINTSTEPCFSVERNKLVSIPYDTKPTIGTLRDFAAEGREKVFEVTYLEDAKILKVKFKKSHSNLKVSFMPEEPRVTIEGIPKW